MREDFLPGLCVPDLDRSPLRATVPAGGGDPLAVGLPGHAEDDIPLAAELGAHLSGLRVPDLGGHAHSRPKQSSGRRG